MAGLAWPCCSGHDASEARSVHRECLWGAWKRKGRPGHVAKMSVTAPTPPLPASCLARTILGAGLGANLTIASEQPASSFRQPPCGAEVCMDCWSHVKQQSSLDSQLSACYMMLNCLGFGTGLGTGLGTKEVTNCVTVPTLMGP
jgi:hypothetical protein